MRMLVYIFLLLVVAGCSYSSTAVTKELDCVQEIMCSDLARLLSVLML